MKNLIKKLPRGTILGVVSIVIALLVFIVPLVFIVLTAGKSQKEASELSFTLPSEFKYWSNFIEVISSRDGVLIRAFANSALLTVFSVAIMVVLAAMVGYVLQRRQSAINPIVNLFVMLGLIIPPAVVPTIWMLEKVHLYKTLAGLITVHVAFGLSFCILMFRAFVSSIPRELDEAATIDGAGPIRLFFSVIFPLLRSVIITVIVVQAVTVFNDFTYALYFLPGHGNETVQLTLYDYQSQGLNRWNLLFMDVFLITIPPLIMFIFFNRKIIEGMTAGAVKG